MSGRKANKPSICRISMGQKLVQTNYDGKVSGQDLLNASVAIVTDCQKMTGLPFKTIFALIDEAVGSEVFKKKPTMRASESEATASEEESD